MLSTTTRSPSRSREPAWHRRSRKQRTSAQACLVSFLRSGFGSPSRVRKAILVLKDHHSRPALVRQAEGFLQQSALEMSGGEGFRNWCAQCRQYARRGTLYCGLCSGSLTAPPPKKDAWTTPTSTWESYSANTWPPKSPRSWQHQPPWQQDTDYATWQNKGGKQPPQSPRGRQRGGNRDKGKAKGKHRDPSKGPGKGKPAEAIVPTTIPEITQLPHPPTAGPPMLPKPATPGPPSPAAIEGNDNKLFAALMEHAQSSTSLPSNLRQMLEEHVQTSTRTETKMLHNLVHQKQAAKQGLSKVRAERLAFESAWQAYLGQLLDLWEKQIATHAQTMENFAKAEISWHSQLVTASTALQAQVGDGTAAVESIDDHDPSDDMISDISQMELVTEKQLERSREQHTQLVSMLAQARDTAASTVRQLKRERESSRSPRRPAKVPTIDLELPGDAVAPVTATPIRPRTKRVLRTLNTPRAEPGIPEGMRHRCFSLPYRRTFVPQFCLLLLRLSHRTHTQT